MKTTNIILFAGLAFTLSACVTEPTVPTLPGTLEGVKSKVQVDDRLFEPCPPVTDIIENPKPSDVLAQHGADVKVINCLKAKNQELTRVLKKAFNTEDLPK